MGGTRASSSAGMGIGTVPVQELPPSQVEEGVNGIKRVVWWFDSEKLSEDDLRQRAEIFNEMVKNVPPESLEGLNRLAFTEQYLWVGSNYIGPNKDPRYVQDELTIEMKQFREMSDRPKMSLVYEEVGHRMQLKTHVPLFKRFSKEAPLNDRAARDFLGLTEDQIVRRAKMMGKPRKEIIAGEMFAKSFGYFKSGAEMPETLRQWWADTGL